MSEVHKILFLKFGKIVENLKTDVNRLHLVLKVKPNFMYFGHKHVETGPNCSHEPTILLKYQTPLSKK